VILGVDGQARHILEEAGAGITIDPENAVALAEAIRRLKADGAACRMFGQNARAYVMERCSREQSAKQYVGVLQEVLERST
jgi:glycosyltransferase involved in cell wall biosynthesis